MNKELLKKAIDEMMEKGMSREKIHSMIESMIMASYKRKFLTDENCVVDIKDDSSDVNVYMEKKIVQDDDCADTLLEISLTDAKTLDKDAEIGDEILIPVDISNFDRISIMNGKQRFRQDNKEYTKNSVFSEFKSKVGQIVIGYVIRTDSRSSDIYVSLGEKVEGILLKKNQIPGETYSKDDKIKCYIEDVVNTEKGVNIILSRASGEFVKKFFTLQVPEISDKIVEIYRVARKAGYRTKIAVYTSVPDIDPVGSCVGVKGARINAVISELSGEKIDIVPYDPDPAVFIASALSPAQVMFVKIDDAQSKKAYAVVDNSQLSYAIGKGGLNVQLASRLTDWMIDIKTKEQYNELDFVQENKSDVEKLFTHSDDQNIHEDDMDEQIDQNVVSDDNSIEDDEEILFSSLPFKEETLKKIQAKGVLTVNEFVELDISTPEEFFEFNDEEKEDFDKVLRENLEFEEE